MSSTARESLLDLRSLPLAVPAPAPGKRPESPELPLAIDERTRQILAHRHRFGFVRNRGWLVRRTLLAADVLTLGLALPLALVLSGHWTGLDATFAARLTSFAPVLPAWALAAKAYRLYDRDESPANHSTIDELPRLFNLLTAGTWAVALGWLALGLGDPNLVLAGTFWVTALVLLPLVRAAARAISRRRIEYQQNTVIVGAGDVGQLVAHKLLNHPEYGINVIGFVDSAPKERREDLRDLVMLGPPERLPTLVRLLDVERVVIAFSNDRHQEELELVRSLRDFDVQIDIVPRLFDQIGPGVHVHTVEGLPLVGLSPLRLSRAAHMLKRTLDVVIAALGLLLLAPALAVIALVVKLDSPGPVLFRQVRMGSGGKPFRVLKFRTMFADADERKHEYAHLNRHAGNGGDARMFKIVDDPRVTRSGRILRRYFLDEVPQLVNVLRSEMSLIGPRPLIADEDRHVDSWGRRRLDLRPGMTGVWQVLGRSAISFDEMVKLDYLYVTTWSLGNDLKLLLRTIPLVMRGEKSVV